MIVTTSWDGDGAFRAALEAAAVGLSTRLTAAVDETANEMKDAISAAAPVDTGALRDSITVASGGLEAVVGTGMPYAARVNFGFHGADSLGRVYNQGPDPFFDTGFESASAGFEARVRAALTF